MVWTKKVAALELLYFAMRWTGWVSCKRGRLGEKIIGTQRKIKWEEGPGHSCFPGSRPFPAWLCSHPRALGKPWQPDTEPPASPFHLWPHSYRLVGIITVLCNKDLLSVNIEQVIHFQWAAVASSVKWEKLVSIFQNAGYESLENGEILGII